MFYIPSRGRKITVMKNISYTPFLAHRIASFSQSKSSDPEATLCSIALIIAASGNTGP